MIYAPMADGHRHREAFPSAEGGVDLRDTWQEIDEFVLEKGQNVWWTQGALRTRPALRAQRWFASRADMPEPLPDIQAESETDSWWMESYTENGVSQLAIWYIDSHGERVSMGAQPLPASCGVMTAIPYGWLAITDTGLYRLPNRLSTWTAYDDHAYVPLVMRNGKGCQPGDIKPCGGETYEEYNRLTDRFSVAFTADGDSSRFYLPVTELNGDAVTAAYTDERGETYVYQIAAGETDSPPLDGRFMRVNRQGGYVQFRDELWENDNAPHASGRSNNLVVTAAKTGIGGNNLIKGMRMGRWLAGDEHRATLFMTGKTSDPALICWSAPGNPLYIPYSQYARVGDSHSPIREIVPLRNRLMLFKNRGLYMLTATTAEGTDRQRFPITLYPSGVGCSSPQTICLGNERLLWLDPDGRVRQLTESQINRREAPDVVSDPIAPALAACSETKRMRARAVWWQERYLLLIGQDIWTLDINHKGHPAWFQWRLDKRLSPVCWQARGDRVDLLCLDETAEESMWVVYRFVQEAQDHLRIGGQEMDCPIDVVVRTKLWDGGVNSGRKRLVAIEPSTANACHTFTLTLRTDREEVENLRLSGTGSSGGLLPVRIGPFRQIGWELSGQRALVWRDLLFHMRWYQEVER